MSEGNRNKRNFKSMSEDELISAIMTDEDFCTWIFDEVLPVIQEIGMYVSPWEDSNAYEIQRNILLID